MFRATTLFLLVFSLPGTTLFAQRAPTSYVPMAALTVEPGKIVVIAHRGEHLHHPENTIVAFQAAIDTGADYFELDVRTTSDGKLVIMHDSMLNRTTNGTGEVFAHTFNEISSLDAGSKFSQAFTGAKVPTLDESLELARGKTNVYVDTKDAVAKELVDTIVRHDMQDHVVIYGNPFFLHEVLKIRPTLRVMPEASDPGLCRFLVRSLHPRVMAFDASDFKDALIEIARQSHAQVFVDRLGDADTPEAWQKAIDQGASGIQTNLPAELSTYLREHKRATH